jgi:hypothetical protein
MKKEMSDTTRIPFRKESKRSKIETCLIIVPAVGPVNEEVQLIIQNIRAAPNEIAPAII